MNRRDLVLTLAASSVAASAAQTGSKVSRPPICIFSKHMSRFGYDELGKKAKEIGFDGVDLTVRPKGHVVPERAAEDMPRAVEALRGHGLSVPMITTNLLTPSEPAARPTMSTAAKLKVPLVKLGYYRYKLGPGGVRDALSEVGRQTAGLTELAKEYGITAGFHNHSGDYVGSAVWDIREIISKLDEKAIGYYFDPAHATIEGGLGGWRISMNMVAPRLKMVALKDFYWAKDGGKWKTVWCPMGEGMVDWQQVFKNFVAAGFSGPLSLHIEYGNDELDAIARDFEFVRKHVSAAWPAA